MADTQQLVNSIVDGIHEKKGREVVIVNLQNIETAPCEYFVLCSGGSPQQVQAIEDSVEEFARKQAEEKPARVAGLQNAEWVAMDYGSVMVHIFLPQARSFYDLEHLWDDASLTSVADVD